MGRWDRTVFRRVVPRAARRAARVLTVSERSKHDLIELYGLDEAKVVVTPNGVDPAFRAGEPGTRDFVLSVGAVQPRKNQIAAATAARAAGFPLVVVGPERIRRRRQPSGRPARRCADTSQRRTWRISTARPPASCSRHAMRASAYRSWRQWRAERRW